MCDIYFNFNLILYVVMRSRSYIGMLDCAILRNKYYYYYVSAKVEKEYGIAMQKITFDHC